MKNCSVSQIFEEVHIRKIITITLHVSRMSIINKQTLTMNDCVEKKEVSA